MEKRVIHTRTESSGGGFGVLGVIIGALIVLGAIFFFAGGSDMFARNGGGASGNGPSVTINTPAAPSAPKAPSAPATTGSGVAR
jgi:hypothetical protein